MSLKVTAKLKSWLTEHKGLPTEAIDEAVKLAAASAMFSDDNPLTQELLTELTADPDAKKATALDTTLTKILDRLEAIEKAPTAPEVTEGAKATPETVKAVSGEPSELNKAFAGTPATPPSGSGTVNVLGVKDRYDTTKNTLVYPAETNKGHRNPLAGRPVFAGVGPDAMKLSESSELEKAVGSAYIKWSIESQKGGTQGIPKQLRMTEHDRQLMEYALHEEKWVGVINGDGSEVDGSMAVKSATKLSDFQRKAILDDATSGGLEIVPISFDNLLITTPVLFGEFFPSVNVVNITRGRRIEGGTVASVTINSGGADGSNIALQNTASFISAFDTTIHVMDGAIEFGLDFLSDSPTSIMDAVEKDYGLKALEWLDDQICVGDGTTEPEGIMVASGTTSVTPTNGATGPPTVGDYEGLLFGVAKNFKTGHPNNRIMFGANETTYSRAMGIAVSGTDQRRVFRNDANTSAEGYNILNHPYGINESFTNRQSFFGVMPRYRMYRRLAPTVKITTEGKTLVRGNLALLTIRGRFGGQIEDGSAFAVNTTGQS